MSIPGPATLWLWLACLGAGGAALQGILALADVFRRGGLGRGRRLRDLLGTDQGLDSRARPAPGVVGQAIGLGWARTPLESWALVIAVAAAGGLAGTVTVGSGVGLLPGLLLALWVFGRHARRRLADRGRALHERLPDALLGLASCLRSGQSLVQAVEVVAAEGDGPLEEAFGHVLGDYRAGVPLLQALRKLGERFPGEDVAYLQQALEIHRLSGGNLAEVLANAASALNERRALKGELEARTAEARLSAVVLLALPVVLGIYFWWTNPEMLRPLWETPAGRVGAAYAILSWLAGRELMARLIASVKP